MVFFKGEFTDDVALLATTREAAKLSVNTYNEICDLFGMKVTFEKTKFMVAGHDIQAKDRLYLCQLGMHVWNMSVISATLALWWPVMEGSILR